MSVLLGAIESKNVVKELKRLLMHYFIADNKVQYNENSGRVEDGFSRQYGVSKRLSLKAFQYAKKNGIDDNEYIDIYTQVMKEFKKTHPNYI